MTFGADGSCAGQGGRIVPGVRPSHDPVPGSAQVDGRVSGRILYDELRDAAAAKGVRLSEYIDPLRSMTSANRWLDELQLAKRPTPSTIARVRALINGQDIPPSAPRPRRCEDAAGLAAARTDAQRPEPVRAAAPPEAPPEPNLALQHAPGMPQPPSFQQMMRQVTSEWPDLWARCRALAGDMDLVPGEVLRRSIEAGLYKLEGEL